MTVPSAGSTQYRACESTARKADDDPVGVPAPPGSFPDEHPAISRAASAVRKRRTRTLYLLRLSSVSRNTLFPSIAA
jgi:hypothetical protein